MRHRLTDILQSRLWIGDEDLAARGAWLDPEAGALRYVGADVGGWLSGRVALVAAGLLRYDGERWHADTAREDIEAATLASDGGLHLDLLDLPPLITGPFGNTVSPLLMAAGLRAEAAEEAPPLPPEARDAPAGVPPLTAEDRIRRLETWDELHGAAVFARDGELGALSDLVLDDRAWDVAELVVTAPGGMLHVPANLVRHRVEAGGHYVLSAERAEIWGPEPA